jgi:hypothetical protein
MLLLIVFLVLLGYWIYSQIQKPDKFPPGNAFFKLFILTLGKKPVDNIQPRKQGSQPGLYLEHFIFFSLLDPFISYKVFLHGMPLQPSLMFVDKARSLPLELVTSKFPSGTHELKISCQGMPRTNTPVASFTQLFSL